LSTYADTSFLVSLYVFDDNSPQASAIFADVSRPFLLTPLIEAEMVNAFYLRIFRKESGEKQIRSSLELFGKDVRAGLFEPKSFSNELFRQASQISTRRTAKFGTRTLDLLHVASAVFLQTEQFCTFDRKQAELARSEGLVVRGC
jgi:predicted nucleic acid-binding protein